jgi:hypothetical protein
MRFILTVTYWQQTDTNQEHSVSVNAAVQHTTLYGQGGVGFVRNHLHVGFVRNRGRGKCSESHPRENCFQSGKFRVANSPNNLFASTS